MPNYRLRLSEPKTVTAKAARSSFHWLSDARSTIYALLADDGHLGPRLGAFGGVREPNIDLVRIAVAIYAADRSTPRSGGGSNWNRRPIHLKVPVLDPEKWSAVVDELTSVVDLLTGDDWSFEFVRTRGARERIAASTDEPTRVVLLSGGADSAAGALLSRTELAGADKTQALLSHFTSSVLAPLQRQIADRIQGLVPGQAQQHIQIHLGRRGTQLDGLNYRNEHSTRSRSLLFIALGLAVASVHDVPLWIPENGFASINPPLGLARLGSLSTRTTHPAFLSGLVALLEGVGAHGEIVNPFSHLTKGEVFKQVADLVGTDQATDFLSATNSCAHTGQRTFGISTITPCGICFGCLVRKASFVAAGLTDKTGYIEANGYAQLQSWLDANSVERAMTRFLERGIEQRDLIAMSLPSDYSLADASDLCNRGMQELRGLPV